MSILKLHERKIVLSDVQKEKKFLFCKLQYKICCKHLFLFYSRIKMDPLWKPWLRGRRIWINVLKALKNVTFAISFFTDQPINCQEYNVRLAKRNSIPIVYTNGFLPVRIQVVLFVDHYFEMLWISRKKINAGPINIYFFFTSKEQF